MKKILYVFSILTILVFTALPARAANLLAGDNVNVARPQKQNVYAAGSQVIIAEELAKDLLVAGANVSINSKVGRDILAAGSSVRVNGPVGDDLRVMAGNLSIDKSVAGDVVAMAGTINIAGDATVDGESILSGGQIVINGDMRGYALITGADIVINGNILGNSDIRGSRVTINGKFSKEATISAENITLGADASFQRGLRYYSSQGQIDFGDKIKGGQAVFDEGLKSSVAGKGAAKKSIGQMATWFLLSLFMAALVLLVLIRPSKKISARAADLLNTKFWKSILAGLLFFIVLPIIGILLTISVIGLPLGLAALAVFGFSVYLAPIVAALIFAKWLENKTKNQWGLPTFYFVSLGLFVILKLLHLIPYIGGLIVVVIALVGFGAALLAKKEYRKKIAVDQA